MPIDLGHCEQCYSTHIVFGEQSMTEFETTKYYRCADCGHVYEYKLLTHPLVWKLSRLRKDVANLEAIAHAAKNVWLWYSCVAEGGRVDEIEALGLALQRWLDEALRHPDPAEEDNDA